MKMLPLVIASLLLAVVASGQNLRFTGSDLLLGPIHRG